MPSKNTTKYYAPNTHYHIYNRGVEKRKIFMDKKDCQVFLRYLKLYLSPVDKIKDLAQMGLVNSRFIALNLFDHVELISFALMPNHIHLLIKQITPQGMVYFTRRLLTSYVMYFNKRHERRGPLFEGVYKAVAIETDEYLLHISRYIHLNPKDINTEIDFGEFSSYPYFLGGKKASWIKPDSILSYFDDLHSNQANFTYKDFVEEYYNDKIDSLSHLTLDEE